MPSFEDLINNPNFGRRYKSNPMVKELTDLKLADLYPQMKIHVTADNKVQFTHEATGTARMTFEEARNFHFNNNTLRSTRSYGRGMDTHFTGAATNPWANMLESKGYKTTVSSHRFKTEEDLEEFLESFKKPGTNQLFGFHQPRGDKGVIVMDVLNPKGERMTYNEVSKALGNVVTRAGRTSENILKRTAIYTSDRDLAILRPKSDPFRVFAFDPKAVALAENPSIGASVQSFLSAQQAAGGGEGLTEEKIYERMFDGGSMMTPEGVARFFETKRNDALKIIRDAEKIKPIGSKNTPEYLEYLRQKRIGEDLLATVEKQKRSASKSGRFNMRVLGAVDQNGNEFELGKGDVGVMSKAQAKAIRKAHGLSPKEMAEFDIIMSAADRKEEITNDKYSFLSLESHGRPSQARSNILSSANHRELIDPDGHLFKGATLEIEQHIKDIQNGEISPGLRAMVNELSEMDIDDIDNIADRVDAIKTKAFAIRLKGTLDSGGTLQNNEFLSNQLFSAMEKHYLTLEGAEKRITHGGTKIPDYQLTFPIKGSIGSHITSDLQSNDYLLQGSLRPHAGVAQIGRMAAPINYAAGGGFDYDDRFDLMFRWDEDAKRLMILAQRQPNEVGEFALYNADITVKKLDPTFNKLIPLEIRMKDGEFKRITMDIAHGNKSTPEKLALMRRRDELAVELRTWFNESKEIPKANFAKTFGEVLDRPLFDPVPKGTERSSEAVEAYLRGSALRGYKTSEELGVKTPFAMARLVNKEMEAESSVDAALLPYKLAPGKDEWYDRYYKKFVVPAEVKRTKRLSTRAAERIKSEFESQHVLGNISNLDTSMDYWLGENLKNLPPQLAKRLEKQWKALEIVHAPKELSVDTIKKTGNDEILDAIKSLIPKNSENWGVVMAKLQKSVDRYNLKNNTNISIGFDPIMLQKRFANQNMRDSFLEGYRSVRSVDKIEDLMAPEGTTYISKSFMDKLGLRAKLVEGRTETTELARNTLLNQLNDVDFTPKVLKDASDFIAHIQGIEREHKDIYENVMKSDGKSLEEMLNGLDLDHVNTAAVRKLHEMGLFSRVTVGKETRLAGNEGLDNMLLAVAKLLSENAKSLGVLESVHGSINGSISTMYDAAKQRAFTQPKALEELSRAASFEKGISKFIEDTDDGLEYTHLAKGISSAERGPALIRKMIDIRNMGGFDEHELGNMQDHANFVVRDMEQSGRFDPAELKEFQHRVNQKLASDTRKIKTKELPLNYPMPNQATIDDIPLGSGRRAARESADAVANEVSNGVDHMTRFDRDMAKRLWEDPIGRKVIIGAGIFAGLGIIHRLTKNPTPEETGGPPLLPGGSAYEDYSDPSFQAVSSMYPSSAPGMLYKVNTSGDYDPKRLSSNLNAITGGSGTTNIYKSRQTVGSGIMSSRDLMNNMMGS